MLEYINDPNDIKRIQPEDYKLLAKDIRRFLLKNVSRTGGHPVSYTHLDVYKRQSIT